MDSFLKGIFQRVRGRKGGKVGEHDVCHLHAFHRGLKHHCTFFHLGGYEDDEAHQHQPLRGNACQHKPGGKYVTQVNSLPCGRTEITAACAPGTKHTASIEWERGQQVKSEKTYVNPEKTPPQIGNAHKRPSPQTSFWR